MIAGRDWAVLHLIEAAGTGRLVVRNGQVVTFGVSVTGSPPPPIPVDDADVAAAVAAGLVVQDGDRFVPGPNAAAFTLLWAGVSS